MKLPEELGKMNCKDFKTRVEEGLKGDSLPIAAQNHAAACRPCREFNQKHVEFREWLTVCEKINAPKDFGFGVQRKIASSGAVHSNDWLWQGLRYIVPSAAAIAVLVLAIGYFSTNSGLPEGKGVAVIANSEIGNPAAKDNTGPGSSESSIAAQTGQPENVTESAKPENEKLAANTNTNRQDNKARVPSGGGMLDSKNGGSFELAVNDSKPSKYPKGLHVGPSGPASLSETLFSLSSNFGILAGVNLRVNGFKPNSPAERSGVKIGDVVESVNGTTLTVKRDGQTLTIDLKQ